MALPHWGWGPWGGRPHLAPIESPDSPLTPASLSPWWLTTVAKKSRVLQLEEELTLRCSEIEELQQCLLHSGLPPANHPEAAETLRLREWLLSASKEHQRESREGCCGTSTRRP